MVYKIILLSIIVLFIILIKFTFISKNEFIQVLKRKYEKKNYDFLYFSKSISYSQKRKFLDFIEDIYYLEELFYDEEINIIIDDKPLNKTLKHLRLNRYSKKNAKGVYIPYLKAIIISVYDLPIDEKGNNDLLLRSEDINVYRLYSGAGLVTLAHEIGHFLEDISCEPLRNNPKFKIVFKNEKDLIFKSEEDNYYKSNLDEYIAQTIAYYLIFKNKLEYEENIFINGSYDTYSLIDDYIKKKERI